MKKNHWYDFLWIWTIVYFALGFFNILFAWLGMIDFLVPLFIAIIGGNKTFCNRYCGRGQLLSKCGKCSRNMIFQTYLVAAGARNLGEAIKLLWMFRIPWDWAYTAGTVSDWIAQFSFGFYSIMLTSTIIGFAVNILFKPRAWCSFCPMGTMTQMICKIKAKEKL